MQPLFQTVYDENEADQKSPVTDSESNIIVPIAVVSVIVVFVAVVAIICYKRRCKRTSKSCKSSQFYVDNVLCEDAVSIVLSIVTIVKPRIV